MADLFFTFRTREKFVVIQKKKKKNLLKIKRIFHIEKAYILDSRPIQRERENKNVMAIPGFASMIRSGPAE